MTDELIEAFRPPRSPAVAVGAALRGRPRLAEMLDSPSISVLMARDVTGALVGSLTLVIFRIPTGVRAVIEDVVVDGAARGRGGRRRPADQGGPGDGRGAPGRGRSTSPPGRRERRPTGSTSSSASSGGRPTSTATSFP